MQQAYQSLGEPASFYKTIHVTGTNGKGSVSLNIARGIESNGYKVGLFTSPHVRCVTERISVQGEAISFEEMEKIFIEHKAILSSFAFFDLLTLLAFLYFKEKEVDYAVIEVGIGGYLDSTNVISSDLAVITGIHIDHTDMLGKTRENIALHKAKIIKGAIPAVLGYYAQCKEVYEQIEKVGAKALEVPFNEDYEEENKAIADRALCALGMETLNDMARMPARFERHGKYIYDMAHNESAFLALKRKMQKHYPQKKIVALWNMASNKEVEKCLKVLFSFVEEVYFYPSKNDRLLTIEEAKKLHLKCYDGEEGDIILVCGSIYLISELLQLPSHIPCSVTKKDEKMG